MPEVHDQARPTLSVVMPNYNDSRFIVAALQSLFAQTRRADEIIVVDDGSTDDSLAVIARVCADHPEVRVIRNGRNLGGVQASNIGLEAVTGDYVFFTAANDVVMPALFERSLALLDAFPRAGLCSSLIWLVDEQGASLGLLATPLVRDDPGFVTPAQAVAQLLADGNWIVGTTTIYKTAALRAAGGFDARLSTFCDAFAGPTIACRFGACFIPEPLGAWRQHRGGLAARTMQEPDTVLQVIDEIRRRGPQFEPALFTPRYIDRLGARWRFESASAILRSASAPLPAGFERLIGRGGAVWRGLIAAARRPGGALRRILVLLLFVWLRPFDILPVLRRRGHWRRRRAAIIGKGFPPIVPDV